MSANIEVTSASQLVFTGGEVITVDADFSVAEAIAVRDGKIVAVGTAEQIAAHIGDDTRVIELHGATVLPGINDSHLHAVAWGLMQPPHSLDLAYPAVDSIAAMVAAVEQAAVDKAPGEWILGQGWDVGYLLECTSGERDIPTLRDLDAVSLHNPVCLTDYSGHALLANSRALEAAGVTAATLAPPGGVIELGPDGEPTGVLREGAQQLVQSRVPRVASAQLAELIIERMHALHTLGITSYTEPGLGPGGEDIFGGGLGQAGLEAYVDLASRGELGCRVSVLALPAPMSGGASDVRSGLKQMSYLLEQIARPGEAGAEALAMLGMKIFADGVPPAKTALMRDEYLGGGNGALCVHGESQPLQVEELREMISLGNRRGYQLGIHVTGDRAIELVTDSLLAAKAESGHHGTRHYLIHADFAPQKTLRVLAENDWGVNTQPGIKWTVSDVMDAVVGLERSAYQWPLRDAFDAGVSVSCSSDAPILKPDWLRSISSMLLRTSKATGRVSGPEQRVTMREAIRSITINPAKQDFAEDWKGSIEVGKVADLCVLGGSLLAADPTDIPEIPVRCTVFAGEIVYVNPVGNENENLQ